ncbi:MAG TPA: Calx-beta domain-containing protein [Thermoanaerobaculia bacterium]|nr:Calx-beta domain-containing protein [Thermoanaerobaculia bacterium]
MRRLALLLALCASPLLHAATFTVNNAGDAGDATPGNGVCATAGAVCTLRAALQEANALAGTDTINLSIGSGAQTIQPASPLPVSSNVTIDGTTQPGSGAGPFILLDGQNATTIGFDVTTGGLTVTIQGFAIGRFTTAGIKSYQSSNSMTIKRCHIGVGLDGMTAMANGDGILVSVLNTGGGSLFIGDAAGGGNVISGNSDMGIEIIDSSSAGAKIGTLTIQGNKIGVGADGMTAVPNVSGGFRVNTQIGTTTFGGSVAGRNILSGNGGSGYETQFFLQTDLLTFSYNYVGVGQDGVTAVPNNGIGANLVARQYVVEENVIAGNGGVGLLLETGSVASNVRANRIGVAADGSAVANGGHGIQLNSLTNLIVGGPGTDANLIANNGGDGIALTNSVHAELAENTILANGGLGIDINNDGVTANDALDADTGPNNAQNYPLLTTAVRAGGITFVNGSLGSAASTTYKLRFFASTTPDATGFGEGETYLGTMNVTTNASGNASFTFQCPAALGTYITATATNIGGSDTSEFSNAILVSGPPQIRMAAASTTTAETGSVALTIERINGATGPASVDWATIPGSAGTSDYASASGSVTFANGETTKTINIAIAPDTLDENAESFGVELSNVSSGTELGSPFSTTIHITDDDLPPSVSIGDAGLAEGNAPLAFNVALSAASGKAITVDFVTSNGTATAGSDYAAAAGTLTFAPGETTKSISVQLFGDANIELDETFQLTLSNETNVTLGDSMATGTITNDDGLPSLAIDDVAVVEGDAATFTVTLSGPSASTVTVGWSTSDGSAISGVDYGAGGGTLTFAPGELAKTIVVTTNDDAIVESGETFFLDLAGPSNATLADAQGGGAIADDDGTPSLSINDPAVVEGTAATFTVTLAPQSALPVSVTIATSDLTADSSDYSSATTTLTFAAGETSKTISIATTNDVIAEPLESFAATLSSPSGATIADANGTATIIDDDGQPRVTIGNMTQGEGNSGLSVVQVPVDLSHSSASTITVVYTIADGTASSALGDYAAGGGTLTFTPGMTSQTISVFIGGDTLIEPDETLAITLGSAVNATIIDDEGIVTIANDDGGAQLSIGNAGEAEGTGGANTLDFAVTLNAPSATPVTVSWTTQNDSALAPSDYTAASGTLTFAPGETTKTIAIAVNTDSAFESDESFFVQLLAATDATIADADAAGVLVNDDPAPAVPSISIGNASVAEGNAGTTPLTFTVTLSTPTISTVLVDYGTANLSATAGLDYVAASGTLTFAPGVTAQTIAVPVIGDTLVETNETFTIALSSPTNGTLGTSSAAGTILEDDVAPAVPSISIANASVAEGNAGSTPLTFTVSLDVATVSTVTVQYATANVSATGGVDYAAASGTLTFAPGVTSQTINVPVIGDTLVETNETFTIALSSPANGTLGTSSAAGTILEDDVAPVIPSISIANASVAEGNAGSTPLTFTVSLDVATVSTVTVQYATANVSATAGVDYAATSGTLTFAPGVTSQTVAVPVIGDTSVESDETFTIALSSPANALLGGAIATGTIVNDDSLPSLAALSIADVSRNEGDAGATVDSFVVTLDAASSVPVSVSYATSAGSASASTDFVSASGTLAFTPGMTVQTIAVAVHGDTNRESDETFFVTLSAPSNATLADASATGTIRNDDDREPLIPTVTSSSLTIAENGGQAFLTLTLSSRPSGASLRWLTRGGTAAAGRDFVDASGTLVFDGLTATIPLTIVDDAQHEEPESFVVELFDAKNLTLDDTSAAVTIEDDDAPLAIILVAGSLQGDANARFGTAVQMLNTGDARAEGTLIFRGADSSDSVFDITRSYALEPHELRSWNDFPAENGVLGLSTIDVLPKAGSVPRMNIRIYDDGGAGTTGFTLPVVTPADALREGDRAVLIAPGDPIAARFNIGIRTLALGASLTITVRDRHGAVLHTRTRDYAPNFFSQNPAAAFAGRAGDYIEIEITRGSAILYGAAVDNITNDPSVEVLTHKE